MNIPPIDQVREDITFRISTHITTRPGLAENLISAYETAKALVSKWKDIRCRLIYVLIRQSNRWMTLQEVARILRIGNKEAHNQWTRLKRIAIRLVDGRKVALFRRCVEMRFRHRGTVDGESVEGGVLLHLQYQERINYREERTISETIEESTRTHTGTYGESIRRQAEFDEAPAEEKEIGRQKLSEIAKGPQGGQLPMFGTGTHGRLVQ